MSDAPVIEIRGIVKNFGRNRVLDGETLSVAPGETFAYLGRNGAGKTTTIRMLLGLIKPDSGTIRVLGLDPQAQPLEVRRRVGYVAEDQAMFGWMRIEQILSFGAPFYPTWDNKWASELSVRFELPLKTKIKHLSKGQRV
jgi:ABC-2 type transport system ATP-binding protein